jgi:septum formation protein
LSGDRQLVLASKSPQRRAILEQLGISFEVRPADVEELEAGDPAEIAVENARRKVRAVQAAGASELVLGVDTVVALGGRIYGKPPDADAARLTLHALSGRHHEVVSGICVLEADHVRTAVARTTVAFRALTEPMVEWYVSTDEWRGRAGGYAIQAKGAALVSRIEGDYLNVVGLPLAALLELEPELYPRT